MLRFSHPDGNSEYSISIHRNTTLFGFKFSSTGGLAFFETEAHRARSQGVRVGGFAGERGGEAWEGQGVLGRGRRVRDPTGAQLQKHGAMTICGGE